VSTPEVQEKLSQAELDHAKRCVLDRLPSCLRNWADVTRRGFHGRVDKFRFSQLTENHFRVSVLQALPPHQQGLDDNTPFTPPMST
jgi:GINS complex subunit 4